MKISNNLIKLANLETLRTAMRYNQAFTKPQLAEATGLSVVTVNALVKTLELSGEVRALSLNPSEGGRPAQGYAYNLNFKMALAIFLLEVEGVDTAHFKVINLLGDVVAHSTLALSPIELSSFDLVIQEYLEAYPSIEGICFGIPGGEVDQVMVVSDYPLLRGKSLSQYLMQKFNRRIIIENDVNLAILGFCKRLEIPVKDSVSAIYFPEKYPPGAAHFINGQVFKGFNGLAGEIKDLPIGINWDHPLDDETFLNAVMKLTQTFAYMLNPKLIVLYGLRLNPNWSESVSAWFTGPLAAAIQPECHFETEFFSDFEAGLLQRSLSMIQG